MKMRDETEHVRDESRHEGGGSRLMGWLLPVAGLLSLIWFCARVAPKPCRAAYPCQRVAAPLASGFVVWILSVICSAIVYCRVSGWLRRLSLRRGTVCILLGAVVATISIVNLPAQPAAADPVRGNEPIGEARGIHPGRVVWVHDPRATDWEGTNWEGEDTGDGYWWESEHTDQTVVDEMMSQAIQALAGETTDAAAWDAIFRHFNQENGHGDVGYQAGEKIAVKINMVTAMRNFGNVDSEGNQTTRLGWVNTSPQVVLALLRQLVYQVGVAQEHITVGDPTAYFPNHYWNHCQPEFPGVRYLAWTAGLGRYGVESSAGQPCETPVYWSTDDSGGTLQDYLPVSYAEAAYLINLACLKGHSSGVTLCAKNHYGSLIRLPDEDGYYNLHLSLPNPQWSPGYGHYRAHVDIIGHSHWGGKTLLHFVDGLYAGYWWEGRPYEWQLPPFGDGMNSDWPSSLFVSQDPVAVDSVAHDFLLAEWPDVVTGGTGAPGSLEGGQEDYLHEAALAYDPPSGSTYDPDGAGQGLPSLGTHEHWNNPLDKQYSRNLGTGDGIELVAILPDCPGDLDADGDTDHSDLGILLADWGCVGSEPGDCPGDLDGDGDTDHSDLGILLADWGCGT